MSNRPRGHDKFTLWDSERQNARHFDERATAEDKRDELSNMVDLELFPPGESPEALYHGDGDADHVETDTDASESPDADPEPRGETVEDGGAEPVEAEVIDHAPDAGDADPELADLPDRNVSEDPLKWMPGEFVDEIDGTQAINRKGFEVLGHFYDIDVSSTVAVAPEDTGHEFCRVEAVAETPDGRRVESHGSAHVDRGDDHYLLLEMADTRARKRALSIATGAGAVAVEELQNEVDE